MEPTEEPVEGGEPLSDSPAPAVHPEPEDERAKMLLHIEARQQVLLENIVICDHILVQLRRLHETVADKENSAAAYETVDQLKSENLADLQSDLNHEA